MKLEQQPALELGERLLAEFHLALPDAAIELRDLRRLTGGASRETWAFDALVDGQLQELVLRRDPPGDVRRDGLALEALAFRAAAHAGVPSPRIVLAGGPDGPLGCEFIVSQRVQGETLARRILCDDAFAAVRPTLACACGEILARIHGIPPTEIPGLQRPEPLQRLRATLDRFAAQPSPPFELALRWLAAHRPACGKDAVVHGDFRNGNLIVDAEGVRAVLDWENVHLGDPIADLGWLCVRAWRFGGAGRVGGFGDVAQLVASYERAGGRSVEVAEVRWWELWGTVYWGLGCMEMAARHLSGVQRSVELAAIGRRTWEQEYDVMLLLDELESGG